MTPWDTYVRAVIDAAKKNGVSHEDYWIERDGYIMFTKGAVINSSSHLNFMRDISSSFVAYRDSITRKEDQHEPNIAEEAAKLVLGDRNESYGDPTDDYNGTALVWSGLLNHKLKEPISCREAILMMAALKVRREITKPKRDNRVDAIGYMLCADWHVTGKKPTPLETKK